MLHRLVAITSFVLFTSSVLAAPSTSRDKSSSTSPIPSAASFQDPLKAISQSQDPLIDTSKRPVSIELHLGSLEPAFAASGVSAHMTLGDHADIIRLRCSGDAPTTEAFYKASTTGINCECLRGAAETECDCFGIFESCAGVVRWLTRLEHMCSVEYEGASEVRAGRAMEVCLPTGRMR